MNDNRHNLNQLRHAVEMKTNPRYMSTKSEVVSHYQKEYGNAWTHAIASDLHGSIKNKRGEDVSVKSIQRRFQGSRLQREGRGVPYQQLGRNLPPIGRSLKGDSISIHIEGTQNRYGGPKGNRHVTHTSHRSIDIPLSGQKAYDFIQNPTFDWLWDEYGVDLGDDGEYSLQGANVS